MTVMDYSTFARLSRLVLAALLLWLATGALQAQVKPLIVIINDQQALPYQQLIESFKASVSQARPDILIEEYSEAKTLPSSVKPSLVLALGSTALSESLQRFSDSTIVVSMILNDRAIQGKANVSAVFIESPALQQLEWHTRLLPGARRVGILYDPENSQDWVDAAKLAAKKLNLEIVAVAVSSIKDMPAALKAIGRQADSILAIPDSTVYSSRTAKAVLLFSFRNRIPFVGLSAAWVKAGALYALDWDYAGVGQQCATMALKKLRASTPEVPSHELAQRQVYQLNLKTARQIKLDISQPLIDGASVVYK